MQIKEVFEIERKLVLHEITQDNCIFLRRY